MTWDYHHSESEQFASSAEIAAKEGNEARAIELYRLAAKAEVHALNDLDPAKTRTLGITLVSAVALHYKAGEYLTAKNIAQEWLNKNNIPSFARDELRTILEAIAEIDPASDPSINSNDVTIPTMIQKAEKISDTELINLMEETIEKKADDVFEEKDRRFRSTWQPRLTLMTSLVAIIISVFALISKEAGSIGLFLESIYNKDKFIINICNVIVSLIAFIFIAKQKPTVFNIQNITKFKSLAELELNDNDLQIYVGNLKNRVEKLVNQFRFHMVLFAFSLILTYGVILLTSDNERERNGYFRITTNLLNLLGALFIQLGFSVLYNKTLEAEKAPTKATGGHNNPNKQQYLNYNSSLYWGVPLLFFVLYAALFISLAVSYGGIYRREVEVFLNRFDLLAGLANGLTMILLFGRYVSIEQSLGHTKLFKAVFENIFYPFSGIPYKTLVSFGIIFILPIYALAQPLFGSLKINAFGDANNFQTMVYGICLIGKICFFHLTYLLITKKLLHLYLYGLVSEIGNFKELEDCFDTKT